MRIIILKTFQFSILLLYSAIAYTQNKTIDSLKVVLASEGEDTTKIKNLISLSENLDYEGDFEKAMQNATEALVLSQKINKSKFIGRAYQQIGSIWLSKTNYTECFRNYQAALEVFKKNDYKQNVANCYFLIAQAYYYQLNYPEALKSCYSSLKLSEETGNKEISGANIELIGYIMYYTGKYDEALKNFNDELKLYQETNNEYNIARSKKNISDVYIQLGKYDEALKSAIAALAVFGKLEFKEEVAWCYGSIGDIFEKMGTLSESTGNKISAKDNFNKSLKNYQLSLQLYQEIHNISNVSESYLSISNLNIDLKNYREAINNIEKSLELAFSVNQKRIISDCYKSLSKLDSLRGDFKQSYEHYKSFILYRDSLFNEDNSKKSLQIQMQYEFDKKDAVAKAEQERKDAEQKRIKNKQYFFIGGLGILVLAVLTIVLIQWRNNKHKQKANIVLQQQNEKVESTLHELKSTQSQLIQSEKMASLGELTAGIAHEIQNPLNFVNNFSEVNKELVDELQTELKSGNTEEAIAISNDIKDNEEKINHHGKRADAIVKGMLQHSRSSSGIKEPTDINALADEYFRLAYHGLRAKDKSFNATMKTDFDLSLEKINIIPQDIGRVILNLLTNAFYVVTEKKKLNTPEYEPTVSISTKKINGKVEIRVSDNGNGIPQKILDKIFQPFFTTKPTGQGTGLGLSLSYDIIKAHGGEIKVETEEGRGTTFKILLLQKEI